MDNSEKSLRDIIRVLFAEERIKEGTKDLLHKYIDEMVKSNTWEEAFIKILDRFEYKSAGLPTPEYRRFETASRVIKMNGVEYEINVLRKQR